MTQATPGWYADPSRAYSYRYWDGTNWSNQVSSGGTSGTDPNLLDPTTASIPPAPGSAAPAMASTPPPPTVQVTQKSGGSGFGTIIGVILAILVVVVLIAVIVNSSGDDSTDPTDTPVVTEAPETPGEE